MSNEQASLPPKRSYVLSGLCRQCHTNVSERMLGNDYAVCDECYRKTHQRMAEPLAGDRKLVLP